MRASSLVGRRVEIARVLELLSDRDNRLISLTGPAGVGKTRLADAVAARVERSRPVLRVGFADVGSLEDAIDRVAYSVGLPDLPVEEKLPAIAGALGNEVLLLDNLEHLPSFGGAIQTLLAAAPKISLLTTSRAALRIDAECVFDVTPLEHADAIALCVERATACGYLIDDETAAVIANAVDRLPLAMELAASRLAVLTPSDLIARLAVTTAVVGAGVDRSIWSSYDLLSVPAARLFRRLAAFAGTPAVAAVEAVCVAPYGLPPLDSDPLDALTELVEASLLSRADRGTEACFTWLRVVHEFAVARLGESGEATAMAASHASWALHIATSARRLLPTSEQARGLAALDADADELLAAARWSIATETPPTVAGELTAALRFYWSLRGRVHTGGALAESLLERATGLAPALRAAAAAVAGDAATARGDFRTAVSRAREAAKAAEATVGNDGLTAEALTGLARAERNAGDLAAALDAATRVVPVADRMGIRRNSAIARSNLADILAINGQIDEALGLLRGVLADTDSGLTRTDEVFTRATLCSVLLLAGKYRDLVEAAGAALVVATALGDEVGRMELTNYRAIGNQHVGAYAAALADADAALSLALDLEEAAGRGLALANRAAALARLGRPAAALHAWAEALGAANHNDEAAVRSLIMRLAAAGQGLLADDVTATLLAFCTLEDEDRDAAAARVAVRVRLGETRAAAAEQRANGLGLLEVVELACRSSQAVAPDATPDDRGGLTRRESEVLRLLALGLTDKEIARSLECSPRTAAAHVGRILAKLAVPTRTAAASRAAELDLL